MAYTWKRSGVALALAFALAFSAVRAAQAGEEVKEVKKERPKAKELSENAKKGLTWIAKRQTESGGWAQGEESAQMGNGMDALKDKPNVADTCMALFALVRSGSTPKEGDYAAHIRKGVDFVCAEVEASDKDGLYVTSVHGTRVQSKIGTYIDTFLAATVLADVKDKMPDEKSNKRVSDALDKVMSKMEKNQKADGTWENKGWAPTIAQGMAGRAMYSAKRSGAVVSDAALDRTETANAEQGAGLGVYGVGAGGGGSGSGGLKAPAREARAKVMSESAGVELYAGASTVNNLMQEALTNRGEKDEVEKKLKEAKTEGERKEAKDKLEKFAATEKNLAEANTAIVKKMEDQKFASGFGSNGGEEYISHLNIGEALFATGGEDWAKWDKAMTENINKIQNEDGSWTGYHCITGRTFCTSAALLVLTIDRMPAPVGAKIKKTQ
jgi:hypothetical protein